jgi:hypothetical protein
VVGLRSLWVNVTLFDGSARSVRLADVRKLELSDETVVAAATFLGLIVED